MIKPSVLAILVTGLMSISASLIADEPALPRYFDETRAISLFAFDNVSIPYTQNLKLTIRSPKRHTDNPVVRRGKHGSPDSWAVQFYGSVIREKDKLRMWYVAVGDDRLDRKVPRSSPCA